MQMLYVIEGNIRAAFVEENGGEGAVVNDLYAGDVMFFPKGLIHYQQNLGCEPATYLAALNNEDPGAVTITTRFFELPSEAIQVISRRRMPLPLSPAVVPNVFVFESGSMYYIDEYYDGSIGL